MIFQDPMTSLNPVLKIGYQIDEAIETHNPASATGGPERGIGLLASWACRTPSSATTSIHTSSRAACASAR